jgi:hypothetical protein
VPALPETKGQVITCLTITGEKYKQFEERAKKCREWQTVGHHTVIYHDEHCPVKAVGAFRNQGLRWLTNDTDYIAHFDVDDVYAPECLERQLWHIQKTGKLVTGFYDCPIYDSTKDKVWIYTHERTNYALGNSLFYKREAWERVKFPEHVMVDDPQWRAKIGGENILSQSVWMEDGRPLMIQIFHGGNASCSIIRSSPRYKEASERQDKAVRELLARA